MDSPEFLDVLLLQIASIPAAPCISVPSYAYSQAAREPLVNLDGTFFNLARYSHPKIILLEWFSNQIKFLEKRNIATKNLKGNCAKALEFLESITDRKEVFSKPLMLAYLCQAMIFALSGRTFGAYTIHGEHPPAQFGNTESFVIDLTLRGFEELDKILKNIESLRVAGPPGVILKSRKEEQNPVRYPWINREIIERAYESRACLVGPARFLLTDRVANQINIPWYLRPQQLNLTSSGIYDIKLTQVSYPFWCRWGDPAGLAASMVDLPKYTLWGTSAEILFKILIDINSKKKITDNTIVILNSILRWLFGRRKNYSQLRFFDAAKEVRSSMDEDKLVQIADTFHLKFPLITNQSEDGKILQSRFIEDIAKRIIEISHLSLPRVFCFFNPRMLRKFVKPLISRKEKGEKFPQLSLRVIARK